MRRFFLSILTLALTPALAAADTVTGSVTYLQRMMLPSDTVVEVLLQDVSLADAAARTLATYRIEEPGAPPYQFAFKYDPAQIEETNSYVLRATARQGDKLLMTTDTAYPVLTRGAGNSVEMVMKLVASPQEMKPDSDFVNTYWKLLTLQGESVPVANGKREPHVILRADGAYSATVGCNMIGGGYQVKGDAVTFQPGPMTMMACAPPLDQFEPLLVQTLGAARTFDVSGETMKLLDQSGGTLATFEAVYF